MCSLKRTAIVTPSWISKYIQYSQQTKGYHPPWHSAISDVTFLWRGIPAQLLPQNVCWRISYSYLRSQNYIPYESIAWCRKTKKGVGGNHPPLGSPRVLSMVTSGHVTKWRSHHSIRHSQKPHAAHKIHGSIFYITGVIADQSFTLLE